MALAVYRKEDLDLRIKRCLVARHELCRASNEATLRAFRNADRFPTFKIFRRPGALRRRVAPGQSRAALVSAGQTIDQRFPNADQSGDWNDGAGAPVEVTGIGFFDRPHNQTGRAPNNIEIHPILSIQFLSQPTPATSPTPIPTAQPSPTGEQWEYQMISAANATDLLITRIPRERRVGSLPRSWLIPVARTNMSDSSNVRSSSRERNVFEGKWRRSIGPTFKTNGNSPIGYAKFYCRSHDAVIRV